jgi:hypothetical protein
MSTGKITRNFFLYVVPLTLLVSYIFTTCYGVEIDAMDERITVVEDQIKEIKTKIDAGYLVTGVSHFDENGRTGIRLTLTGPNGPETRDVYDGVPGAPGANGRDGTNGTTWTISEYGTWVSSDMNGTPSDTKIPATGNKSPEIKNGYWMFYTWNAEQTRYDTIQTNFVADSLSTYIVDHGQYYELFIPVQLTNAEGELLFNEANRPMTELKMIKLPKWIENPNAPLFFKILGYAEIIGTDTFYLQELNLDYYKVDSFYNYTGNYRATLDSSIWKWEIKDKMPFPEYNHIIPDIYNKKIAVVFSINKPKTFMRSLRSDDIGLYDSRGMRLNFIGLETPDSLSGLIATRGGSNGDTLYYAMMRNDNGYDLPIQGAAKTYYRLVIQDSIRSEYSSSSIALLPAASITPSNIVQIRASDNTLATIFPGPPDTFDVKKSLQHSVSLSPSGIYYDYYISTSLPADSVALSVGSATYQNYKAFKINTTNPNYMFPLGIYKLQLNGAIYVDTVIIRATP